MTLQAEKSKTGLTADAQEMRSLSFEELELGMRSVISHVVTDSDVVCFAQISGDNNPIHLSDEYASKTRFGGRIAHGLYVASLISAVLGTKLPGPGAVYRSQTLNFLAPVRIGDDVIVTVEVVKLIADRRKVHLHCEAVVNGQPVLEGEAVVSMPPPAKA